MFRKTIHLFSSVIPLMYIFWGSWEFYVYALSVLSAVMVLIDFFRYKDRNFNQFYMRALGNILRTHELNKRKTIFTGGTYLIIAFLICVLIFPRQIAIISMLILSVCDSAAAISGKIFGKKRIKNKTLEGSIGFFITGVLIIFLTPKMSDSFSEYYIALTALVLTTLFELIPLRIDDNFSIPVFFGAVYLLLFNIFI